MGDESKPTLLNEGDGEVEPTTDGDKAPEPTTDGDKAPEPTTDGDKAPEPKKTLLTDEGPADYELELPDGIEPDEGLITALKANVRDKEAAQALAAAFLESQERAVEQSREAWRETTEQWETEIRNDKNFKEDMAAATAAMRQFASDDLRQFLADSGLGNHPLIFKLMADVGRALAENKVGGEGVKAPAAKAVNPLFAIFDHPTSKQARER